MLRFNKKHMSKKKKRYIWLFSVILLMACVTNKQATNKAIDWYDPPKLKCK